MSWVMRRPNRIISWSMEKGTHTRIKKLVWTIEVSPDNQDGQDQGSSSSKDIIGVIDCLECWWRTEGWHGDQ